MLEHRHEKGGNMADDIQHATQKPKPTQSNQSSEKLLHLVEALSLMDEPVRLQDLSAKLGMNASTVLRFLNPLVRMGYVDQNPDDNRYYLTFKICRIANNVASRMSIRNVAYPVMRNVSRIFKESANLSVENDMLVLYVEVVNAASNTLMTMQRIGHVAPMHCTGVGKLFMQEYSIQKVDQFIATKGMERFTEKTITDRESLLQEIARIRERGYAIDDEECEIGARCVAVPVRNYTGHIVAGLSVSGPATRMTDAHIHANLSFLQDAAKQISYRLGWKEVAETDSR
jgi:DNA-binding IclR family transcriptional regulator